MIIGTNNPVTVSYDDDGNGLVMIPPSHYEIRTYSNVGYIKLIWYPSVDLFEHYINDMFKFNLDDKLLDGLTIGSFNFKSSDGFLITAKPITSSYDDRYVIVFTIKKRTSR